MVIFSCKGDELEDGAGGRRLGTDRQTNESYTYTTFWRGNL